MTGERLTGVVEVGMPYSRVLLAAVALCSGHLQAQSFLIGVRAGQTTSRQLLRFGGPFAVEDGFSADVIGTSGFDKTGALGKAAFSGLSVTVEFNQALALESDLAFVEKGMRDGSAELHLSYIELTTLLRLAAPISDNGVHLFVDGGPAPSQEVSCRARQTVNARTFSSADCSNWRETKRDFGWALGGGVLIRRPFYQLTFSWRTTRGRRDLENKRDFIERYNDTKAFLIGFVARVR